MANKMTYGKALAYVLENCEMPQEIHDKVEALSAALAKKNSAERKPTKTQEANATLREEIAEYVRSHADEKYLVSDLIKVIPALDGMSPQKVGPLVRRLEADGVLTCVVEKRRNYYKAA